MDDKTIKTLRSDLKIHAHALSIPPGAANDFIDIAIDSVQKSLAPKTTITSADLTRVVAKELKKYHSDLAYVYKNRDIII